MKPSRFTTEFAAIVLCLCLSISGAATAQQRTASDNAPRPENKLGSTFVRNLLADQRDIWTAPAKIRLHDATWLAPFGAFTAGLIATDRDASRTFRSHPNVVRRSRTLSDVGLFTMGAGSGAMYVLGRLRSSEHQRETGLLMGQSMINSLAVAEGLKLVTQRQRPEDGDQNGRFWDGGSSFPSSHAMLAWSGATVLANEYPGPLTKLFAYGGASAISLARVTGRKHFPSDVVVGSTLGYLIGRHVYRVHHARDLNGASWGTFENESDRSPDRGASTFVPIDSWVYAAFNRLSALGFVDSGLTGLRPWTRRECARLTSEAEDAMETATGSTEASGIIRALQAEFADELQQNEQPNARIESLYMRAMHISGTPLRDGFHFGQTIINDFGRPYGEGWNAVAGMTARAEAGPLAFYVRAEGQHSAAIPGISQDTASKIAVADFLPQYPTTGQPTTERVRLLEAYVNFSLKNWQVTAGKQSLWWGPGAGGPLLFSNNAEPVPMVRLSRVEPFKMPFPLHWMGPVRTEIFVGQLTGHRFIFSAPNLFEPPQTKQPLINGQKISFKPTKNLEFGVSTTALLGGSGFPVTAKSLARSLWGRSNASPGQQNDPGDRRAGFDFSYRIPKLRDWLVLYNDSLADDEISPIGYPRRSAMQPGIYMPRIPRVPKLDLRVEAAYTNLPGLRDTGFFYFNARYRSGYTNAGNLIGNWVGRDGRGVQVTSTYWLGPQRTVAFGYRSVRVDPAFLGGGRINDFLARADIAIANDISLQTMVQVERWKFPSLAQDKQMNGTASVQITYKPSPGRIRECNRM